ncbi:MAG: hypothetical protein AAF483_08530 [Planctomycetota bacterium]
MGTLFAVSLSLCVAFLPPDPEQLSGPYVTVESKGTVNAAETLEYDVGDLLRAKTTVGAYNMHPTKTYTIVVESFFYNQNGEMESKTSSFTVAPYQMVVHTHSHSVTASDSSFHVATCEAKIDNQSVGTDTITFTRK